MFTESNRKTLAQEIDEISTKISEEEYNKRLKRILNTIKEKMSIDVTESVISKKFTC